MAVSPSSFPTQWPATSDTVSFCDVLDDEREPEPPSSFLHPDVNAASAAAIVRITNNVFVVFIIDICILPGSQHVPIRPGKPRMTDFVAELPQAPLYHRNSKKQAKTGR